MAITIPSRAPALDLTSDAERPFVRINHVDYDVRILDDFAAPELHQLDRMMPRVVPLALKLERGEATETECEELSALLTALLAFVLVAPAEIVAALGDVQKVKVFKVFMDLLPPSLQRARASLGATGLPSPGPTSSPGSNGSTPGTSRRGRRGSR